MFYLLLKVKFSFIYQNTFTTYFPYILYIFALTTMREYKNKQKMVAKQHEAGDKFTGR